MRVFSISLALSCALLTAYGSPTRAAEPQSQQAAVEATDLAIETQEEEVLLRKARNEEMTQRIERRDDEIASLTAELEGGVSALEAHAIHQRIARIKVNAELDLLEIQARHARVAGNEELAQQVEEIVAARREKLRASAPVTLPTETGKE